MPVLSARDEARVQAQMAQLRNCGGDYALIHEELLRKRLAWWNAHAAGLRLQGPRPRRAYTLVLLEYMGLNPHEVPVVYEDGRLIVWRSVNFCPTLEACRRLSLDTRLVCRLATEGSVQALISRLDPRLRFSRNYAAGIRPYTGYCEEWIELALPRSA